MHELGPDDDGTTVFVPAGSAIDIVLPANATTGYLWGAVEVPDVLDGVTDELVPAGSGRPGAGGEHRFRFVGAGSGSGDLTLVLRRPWERDTEAIDRFTVRVTVWPED